jgi:uncharacterized protein
MKNDNTSAFSGPGPTQVFQDFLAQGKFMLQQCKDCGGHVFYPRVLCVHCGSVELTWVEASGRGVVYSTTVVRQKPPAEDYNVALIDLEEGPRMMGRVIDLAPDKVRIGMRVSAHVSVLNGEPAVIFSSKEQGSNEW